MARRQNRLPAYQFHKATGQAVVKIAGRFFYLGEHDSPASHAEWKRLTGEWVSQGCPKVFRDPKRAERVEQRLTIKELILSYWTDIQGYYVQGDHQTGELGCIRGALRYVREAYGETAVDDFGPRALKAVRQQMIEAGLCRKYINKQVLRIRRMFSWGVENELVAPHIPLGRRPESRFPDRPAPRVFSFHREPQRETVNGFCRLHGPRRPERRRLQ
jgi:hypothetical protein